MTDDKPKTGEANEPDPRLDNRRGDQRPKTSDEIKPQQIVGGQPGNDDEFEDPPSGAPRDPNKSEGPHGRGPQAGPGVDED
jgi:hypothetical protein